MGAKASLPVIDYTSLCTPPNDYETGIYRNPNYKETLVSCPSNGNRTLAELYLTASQKFSRELFIGSRIRGDDGRIGDYRWLTHKQVFLMVQNLSFKLSALQTVEENAMGLKCVGIFSKSREEWLVTDLACIMQGYTVVPIYDVYGEAEILKAIAENEITTIACGLEKLHIIFKLKEHGLSGKINTLICFDTFSSYEVNSAQALNIQLLQYSQLVSEVSEGNFNMPEPDNIFTICYTSGVNGLPRGVKLTHRNAVAALGGIEAAGYKFTTSDRYMSYMPLAHMMERTFQAMCIFYGVQIGFYAGDIRQLIDDIAKLQPTIFCSVPRLFMVIYDTIRKRYDDLTNFKQSVVRKALASKMRSYETKGQITSKFWDKLVFSKTKTVLGGKIRLMVTGSASISPEIVTFLKIVFCCPMIEGYGQTETCAASFISKIPDFLSGHFGGPLPCLEFKLVDVPELGYFHTDTDSRGQLQPRGEMCIRGPSVSVGYIDQDLTMKDEEGWLHTGDICTVLSVNSGVKFIGRLRNIFKLAQGEFFSPERLEAIYGRSAFVSQIILYGDCYHSFLVAVVFPCEDYIRTYWQNSMGRPWEGICRDPNLESEILADLASEARKTHLMGFEYVRKVTLVSELFPAHLTTPTEKLKRNEAYEHFRLLINSMY
mmetsp:Transcript_15984/g.29270  ORF Transcript_15984/g.29270 Transcript_15984/m.29270 type:complete len:656 (+) Transcript_15984:16-1983(+)